MCCLIILLLVCSLLCGINGDGHVWTYQKNDGPDQWHLYYDHCGGQQQSPINIDTSVVRLNTSLPVFNLTAYSMVDNVDQVLENVGGHTVEVDYSGQPLIINGGGLPGDYKVDQLHFHWGLVDARGSEHEVNGQPFSMEMHIVHHSTLYANISEAIDKANGLAVLAFFFEVGDFNEAVHDLIDNFVQVKYAGTKVNITSAIQLSSLLPKNMNTFWRYHGSLTTPPCYESVIWTIFYDKIIISEEQMIFYRSLDRTRNGERQRLLDDDFRPVQSLNHRIVETNNPNGTYNSNKAVLNYLHYNLLLFIFLLWNQKLFLMF